MVGNTLPMWTGEKVSLGVIVAELGADLHEDFAEFILTGAVFA